MTATSRVVLVAGGYVGAFLMAAAVVSLYVAATSGVDRQTYAAMFDFGDTILFLAVFGVASLPATGAAMFFLRPYPGFWWAASLAALAVAATAPAGLVFYRLPAALVTGSVLQALAQASPLRFLLAPMLSLAFLVALAIAPTRGARIAFLAAALIEAVVFLRVALIWFHPFR